jgi:hypothetical protein
MREIWIIGLGQFGLQAVRYLSKQAKDTRFVLVDEDGANLEQAKGPNRSLQQADGVAYLEHNLKTDRAPDWIIPALPLHLAAEWCLVRQKNKRFRRIPLPAEIENSLPNPMAGDNGDLYVSHADFRCPDDCAEPRNICTFTQKPRKRNMFDLLTEVKYPHFQPLVIRTLQLGPGIGGYRPVTLFKLLQQVHLANSNLLVSTACRCHGVVTAMQFT